MARLLSMLAACSVFYAFNSSASVAHSWYPISCCSERDCRPLTEARGESVLESPEGWGLWDGRAIPRREAKASPDGKFHLCENPAKRILCFFAPLGVT